MTAVQELTQDEVMQRDVLDALHAIHAADPVGIGVEVSEGCVTLDGVVDTYQEKWLTERAALRVQDVRGVANDIVVAHDNLLPVDDAEILRLLVHMMDWAVALPQGSVQVAVVQGRAVLIGTVDRGYQKAAAEQAARRTPGVRAVANLITVQ